MPKTRKTTKKEAEKKEIAEDRVATFQTNNQIAAVVDKSVFETTHPVIMGGKDREIKKMQKRGEGFAEIRNQKKQMGFKRNTMNIKQNYKFKSLK